MNERMNDTTQTEIFKNEQRHLPESRPGWRERWGVFQGNAERSEYSETIVLSPPSRWSTSERLSTARATAKQPDSIDTATLRNRTVLGKQETGDSSSPAEPVYLLRYEPPNCRWAPSSACWRLSFPSMREPSSGAVVTEQRVRRRIQISGLYSCLLYTSDAADE